MLSASTMTSVSPFMQAHPMANASASGGSASTQSATVSANDFLTLLVTEMKNQDPTAQTDPNEYINQLVQVNSLEQLIQINQSLSSALGNTSGSETPESSDPRMDAVNASSEISAAPPSGSKGQFPGTNHANIGTGDVHDRPTLSPGNVSIPAPNPAAQRVARSLSGHS